MCGDTGEVADEYPQYVVNSETNFGPVMVVVVFKLLIAFECMRYRFETFRPSNSSQLVHEYGRRHAFLELQSHASGSQERYYRSYIIDLLCGRRR